MTWVKFSVFSTVQPKKPHSVCTLIQDTVYGTLGNGGSSSVEPQVNSFRHFLHLNAQQSRQQEAFFLVRRQLFIWEGSPSQEFGQNSVTWLPLNCKRSQKFYFSIPASVIEEDQRMTFEYVFHKVCIRLFKSDLSSPTPLLFLETPSPCPHFQLRITTLDSCMSHGSPEKQNQKGVCEQRERDLF